MQKLEREFFARDCLEVAPELVGKLLEVPGEGGPRRLRITEVECYRGEQDTACHARFGRTRRSEVLYMRPGTLYVYLCYGIHSLLNVVTGEEDQPQAVLIRACEGAPGPGRLTKALGITTALNRRDIEDGVLCFLDDGAKPELRALPRVGIGYASAEDQARLWRFSASS